MTYWRLLALAVVVLIADQWSKWWIVEQVPESTYFFHPEQAPIEVIPGFFYIVHIYNPGAAWGIFEGYGFWLAMFGVAALLLIFLFRKQLDLHQKWMQVGFGLLIGGVLGNMIDRLRFGHVIDFLDFHLGSYRYPAFNLADVGITVGIAIYLIASFCESRRQEKAELSPLPSKDQASGDNGHQ